jgi:hypothetical protein
LRRTRTGDVVVRFGIEHFRMSQDNPQLIIQLVKQPPQLRVFPD